MPSQELLEQEVKNSMEIWEFIQSDLSQIEDARSIITEGAAYLPKLMKQLEVPAVNYISINFGLE